MSSINQPKIERRDEKFAKKISTSICEEIPSSNNPYIAEKFLLHGYDQLELARCKGFVDVLYMLFRGELPEQRKRELLETLMIGLCNPGPRHPAARAAAYVGSGKSKPTHILTIAISIIGGAVLGGEEVEASMRFIRSHVRKNPEHVVAGLMENSKPIAAGDYHIAPGFGTRFGSTDLFPEKLAHLIAGLDGAGKALLWATSFVKALQHHGYSWLSPGVAAAAFLDLGFHPREGAGLFQLLNAPGLLAYGVEALRRPVTAIPFIDNDHYFIEESENE